MASSTKAPTQLQLLEEATTGFNNLLNNDVPEARRIFGLQPESPFSLLGLGLTSFLAAALGQEDRLLAGALAILYQAETAATRESGLKRAKSEPATVFPPGVEYKVLIADAVICQALVHVLTESYLEFMKAIYKLNRAYKGFGVLYKIVFPAGVNEEDSLASIYTSLNAMYLAKKNSTPVQTESSFFSWGSKKRVELNTVRRTSSAVALPTLANLSLKTAGSHDIAASVPNSRPGSASSSVSHLPIRKASTATVGEEEIPAALWEGDALSTLVISGAAFGTGLFGLIFSLLPPKFRKLISWFGFTNSNRSVALKLLTVAASTGSDVHGYFASLALVTYYCVILLMSGWQAEEHYLLSQCEAVLARVEERFPNGTLWVLNRAKMARMKHDTKTAIAILEEQLKTTSTFREADSLLVFELSWCYLSDGQWLNAANSFVNMREKNGWSHATYVFIAAGALMDLPESERTVETADRIEALMLELPTLFGFQRILGEPPSTELFIQRKLSVYQKKHARWVAQGRLPADSKYWEVIRVSPASELGLFWNTNGRAPPAAVQEQINHLASFSPTPEFGPKPTTTPVNGTLSSESQSTTTLTSVTSKSTKYEIDSIDELCTRSLLLGALYRSLGELTIARQFLESVLSKESSILEEKWTVPFAVFELAVVECQEGDREMAACASKVEGGKAWRKRGKKADVLLDSIFAKGEYDLKSRLESRAQMLRDEVATKRSKLAPI